MLAKQQTISSSPNRQTACKAARIGGLPVSSSSPTRSIACNAASARHCIVIGGGIGGLVIAAKLAQASDYKVTLLEQNQTVGGRCQSTSFEGCRFDTGPSLLLLPQVYRDTLEWLGSDISTFVRLQRVEPAAYRVHFCEAVGSSAGSSSLDLLYDVQQMVQQLEQVELGAGAVTRVGEKAAVSITAAWLSVAFYPTPTPHTLIL